MDHNDRTYDARRCVLQDGPSTAFPCGYGDPCDAAATHWVVRGIYDVRWEATDVRPGERSGPPVFCEVHAAMVRENRNVKATPVRTASPALVQDPDAAPSPGIRKGKGRKPRARPQESV